MSFTIFWKNNESFVPNLYYSVLPFKVLFFEAIPAWCNKTYPIVFSQSSKHFSNSILDFSSVLLPYRNVSLSNFTFFFGKDKSHRARADKYGGGGHTPRVFVKKIAIRGEKCKSVHCRGRKPRAWVSVSRVEQVCVVLIVSLNYYGTAQHKLTMNDSSVVTIRTIVKPPWL